MPGKNLNKKLKNMQKELSIASKVIEAMREGLLLFDSKGNIKSVNKSFLEITGYSSEDLIAKDIKSLKLMFEGYSSINDVLKIAKEKGEWKGKTWGLKQGGKLFRCDSKIVFSSDSYILLVLDTTQQMLLESDIRALSIYDSLTGLPNRSMLYEHLSVMICEKNQQNGMLAVVFVDIDNFKLVNDTMGHEAGDLLLKAVAEKIKGFFKNSAFISRFGGDEFVIILEDVISIDDVKDKVSNLLKHLAQPVTVSSREVFITVTAGISIFPVDGSDPQTLLKNADVAMYSAKESGAGHFKFFTQSLRTKVNERFTLASEIHKAINRKEFLVYYQPQIELVNDTVTGIEALIRWNHPYKGIILPSRFIPVIEESNLIHAIGEFVLKKACQDCAMLAKKGIDLKVSANVSPNQIYRESFIKIVEESLEESNLAPEKLELEITENVLIKNKSEAIRALSKLKAIGVSIVIDDFGTSYSSLNYLKYFPVDKLKIDSSFIVDITTDPNDVVIATTIIAIAHNLGMKATAEGVESEEQFIFLKLWQCDEAQGFFFSPPVPLDKLIELINTGSLKFKTA